MKNADQKYTDILHLTDDEVEIFYTRYLTEKPTDLVKEYNLSDNLFSSLHLLFPDELATSKCQLCNGEVYSPRLRKSEINDKNKRRIGICHSCSHKSFYSKDLRKIVDSYSKCNCDICLSQKKVNKESELKRKEEKKQNDIKLIQDAFDIEYRTLPFDNNEDSYSLSSITMLMALLFLRWGGIDDYDSEDDYISSVESGDSLLYPYDYKIDQHPITQCIKSHVIRFDLTRSYLNYFEVTEDSGVSYFPLKIPFQTNFINSKNETQTNYQVYEWLSRKFSDGYIYSNWRDELLDVWLDLGVAECIEYAKSKADEYSFGFNSEVKISEIIRDLLLEHSVSECFYFISTSYLNAAAFYQSNRAKNRKHAENTIPGKIIQLANSGSKKSWDRPRDLPRSGFSLMLFDVILNTKNDYGFYHCPGKSYLTILNNAKFEWTLIDDQPKCINITGDEGVYEFLECLPDISFEVSKDNLNIQLMNLAWIAKAIGLNKASDAISDSLSDTNDS